MISLIGSSGYQYTEFSKLLRILEKKPTIIDNCDANSMKIYAISFYHATAPFAILGGLARLLYELY